MTDAVKMAIEALRPFADAAGHIHPAHPDEATSLDGFPMSDFRRAAQALAALEQAGESVADAGGVTADNAVFLAFREALMFTWKRSEPDSEAAKDMFGHSASFTDMAAAVLKIHRQSVAAATAAKDAEIARLMRVIDVFRRHYELNDCDGRTGNIEIPVSALRAAASLPAALSEAREAGDSLAAGDRV